MDPPNIVPKLEVMNFMPNQSTLQILDANRTSSLHHKPHILNFFIKQGVINRLSQFCPHLTISPIAQQCRRILETGFLKFDSIA